MSVVSGSFNSVPSDTERKILIFIGAVITAGLTPFAAIRFIEEDWTLASLDAITALIHAAMCLHAYLTKRINVIRVGIALNTCVALILVLFLTGADKIIWVYPTLTTVFYLLPPKRAAAITVMMLASVVAVVWKEMTAVELLTLMITTSATYLFSFAFSTKMHKQSQMLEQIATTDELTGIGNRRALAEKMREVTQRLTRDPAQRCTLAVLDIDHFKRINDEFGHAEGDSVLQRFAALIAERIRATDSFFRFGGEEFVLVLDTVDANDARGFVELLSREVEKAEWPQKALRVTVSVGIAQYASEDSPSVWLQRADAALYQAKANGRNRSVVAGVEIEASNSLPASAPVSS